MNSEDVNKTPDKLFKKENSRTGRSTLLRLWRCWLSNTNLTLYNKKVETHYYKIINKTEILTVIKSPFSQLSSFIAS